MRSASFLSLTPAVSDFSQGVVTPTYLLFFFWQSKVVMECVLVFWQASGLRWSGLFKSPPCRLWRRAKEEKEVFRGHPELFTGRFLSFPRLSDGTAPPQREKRLLHMKPVLRCSEAFSEKPTCVKHPSHLSPGQGAGTLCTPASLHVYCSVNRRLTAAGMQGVQPLDWGRGLRPSQPSPSAARRHTKLDRALCCCFDPCIRLGVGRGGR